MTAAPETKLDTSTERLNRFLDACIMHLLLLFVVAVFGFLHGYDSYRRKQSSGARSIPAIQATEERQEHEHR